MSDEFHIFRGDNTGPAGGGRLPEYREPKETTDPANYIADKGLVNAVNVAIALSRPLLLTGEPGTGKTQLAYRVAHELTPACPENAASNGRSLA